VALKPNVAGLTDHPAPNAPGTARRDWILNTAGMKAPQIFRDVALGRFNRIPNQPIERVLLGAYVDGFSDQCQQFLPPDKVGFQRTTTTYTHYWSGFNEAHTETEDLQVFAEPRFAAPYVAAANLAKATLLQMLMQQGVRAAAQGGTPSSMTANLFGDWISAVRDTRQLLTSNGCASPATKRYAENLYRLMTSQGPVNYGSGEVFIDRCGSAIGQAVPGGRPSQCGCLYQAFHRVVPEARIQDLEDSFTDERFLITAVSKVGLRSVVGGCLR
jgi:hypothetical protein